MRVGVNMSKASHRELDACISIGTSTLAALLRHATELAPDLPSAGRSAQRLLSLRPCRVIRATKETEEKHILIVFY